MRRLDSKFVTAYFILMPFGLLAYFWGSTIYDSIKGNHRTDVMYYILPPCTFLLLWFFSRFKQVTLDGDTLMIRGFGQEGRVPASEIKQVYQRNGKMPYVSIVFKSDTQFGRCVRIMTMDVDKVAKMLRAAMEGKIIGAKINFVSDESTETKYDSEAKTVIVSGWSNQELKQILSDFADVHDFEFQVCADKGASRITFPHDIPVQQFSFLINCLQYPKNFDLKTRSISVVGKALVTSAFHPPNKNLIGQRAVFYIPTNDQSYDLVYVRVGEETFENSFAARHWKKVTDSRMPAGIELIDKN
jgi:hypothetical protein